MFLKKEIEGEKNKKMNSVAKKIYIYKKKNSFILTSWSLRPIWHSARSNFVFVNIHRTLAFRLLKVQRKREANGAGPLIMRGILKSHQLVENLRLSFELLSYAFHKMTVKRRDRWEFPIEEMQIHDIIQLFNFRADYVRSVARDRPVERAIGEHSNNKKKIYQKNVRIV